MSQRGEVAFQGFPFFFKFGHAFLGQRVRLGEGFRHDRGVRTNRPDLLKNQLLKLCCRNRFRWAGAPAHLLGARACVIPVAPAIFPGRMRWDHGPIARHTAHQAFEDSAEFVSDMGTAGNAIAFQYGLHALPDFRRNNPGMFAIVDLGFVFDIPWVDDVGQQLVEAGLGEDFPAAFWTFASGPAFIQPATAFEFLNHGDQSLMLQVQTRKWRVLWRPPVR